MDKLFEKADKAMPEFRNNFTPLKIACATATLTDGFMPSLTSQIAIMHPVTQAVEINNRTVHIKAATPVLENYHNLKINHS